MCCGKSKNGNGGGGAQLRSFSLSENGSGLISGEISESSYLIYQTHQQLNFWGLTAKGEPKRQYVVKGINTCVEVDSRDVKYLLSLKRNKRPYFAEDFSGKCREIKEILVPEILTEYGVFDDGFVSKSTETLTPEIYMYENEVINSMILGQEEIQLNPLPDETLQKDMYLDSVGSPEILHQNEEPEILEQEEHLDQLITTTFPLESSPEDEEIPFSDPEPIVIVKPRKQRTKNA